MIEEIIQREWDFFQKVQHIDGRASCQDDFETFYLQRKSQFQAFYQDVRVSYLQDLKDAQKVGRNLVMEKYAYMMEFTDPIYFQTIKEYLPVIDESKRQLVDSICEIEVSMREEFNHQYPALAHLARATHRQDDEIDDTSFETYLRGELFTYSPHTLYLYGQMIAEMVQHKQNIVTITMGYTVKSYGYASLEEAQQFYEKHE